MTGESGTDSASPVSSTDQDERVTIWRCPECGAYASDADFELRHHVLAGPDHRPIKVEAIVRTATPPPEQEGKRPIPTTGDERWEVEYSNDQGEVRLRALHPAGGMPGPREHLMPVPPPEQDRKQVSNDHGEQDRVERVREATSRVKTGASIDFERDFRGVVIPSITIFECPCCEWAATTGAAWDQCPHCESEAVPEPVEVTPVAALEAAEARIANLEAERDRLRALYDDLTIRADERRVVIDELEAKLDRARKARDQALQELEDTRAELEVADEEREQLREQADRDQQQLEHDAEEFKVEHRERLAAESRTGTIKALTERYRGALEAIADGRWSALLDSDYPRVEYRTTAVPPDASIRVLARQALADTEERP